MMPIKPENKERYPKDWKSVVIPRIRSYDSLMKILSRDQKKITDAVKGLYKRL